MNSDPDWLRPSETAVNYPRLMCLTVKSSSTYLVPSDPTFSSPSLPPEIPKSESPQWNPVPIRDLVSAPVKREWNLSDVFG